MNAKNGRFSILGNAFRGENEVLRRLRLPVHNLSHEKALANKESQTATREFFFRCPSRYHLLPGKNPGCLLIVRNLCFCPQFRMYSCHQQKNLRGWAQIFGVSRQACLQRKFLSYFLYSLTSATNCIDLICVVKINFFRLCHALQSAAAFWQCDNSLPVFKVFQIILERSFVTDFCQFFKTLQIRSKWNGLGDDSKQFFHDVPKWIQARGALSLYSAPNRYIL